MSPERTRVPLSLLDLAPVLEDAGAALAAGGPAPEDADGRERDPRIGAALRTSIRTAQTAERLGYHRVWVAEHHSMPGIASSATTVLMGQLLAATTRIRIGSGGIMLPNHPPLVVAEAVGTLDALYPGRVDLGLGRAPGTDPVTAHALRRTTDPLSVDDYPRELAHLRSYFAGQPTDPSHPYASIAAVPGVGAHPEVWLLGSSTYSARLAGELGLPFSFARHFSPRATLPALRAYREAFTAGAAGAAGSGSAEDSPGGTSSAVSGTERLLGRPHAMVCVVAVGADDPVDAEHYLDSQLLQMARLRRNDRSRVETPDRAAELLSAEDRAALAPLSATWLHGDAEGLRRHFDTLLADTQAEEIMVTSPVHDPEARARSLEIITEALAT